MHKNALKYTLSSPKNSKIFWEGAQLQTPLF